MGHLSKHVLKSAKLLSQTEVQKRKDKSRNIRIRGEPIQICVVNMHSFGNKGIFLKQTNIVFNWNVIIL